MKSWDLHNLEFYVIKTLLILSSLTQISCQRSQHFTRHKTQLKFVQLKLLCFCFFKAKPESVTICVCDWVMAVQRLAREGSYWSKQGTRSGVLSRKLNPLWKQWQSQATFFRGAQNWEKGKSFLNSFDPVVHLKNLCNFSLTLALREIRLS